jgi:hypothetical protein
MHQETSNMTEVVRHLNGFKLLLLLLTTWMVITVDVQAVDIQGFSSSSSCSGSGFTFAGIAQRICAVMNVGSVLVRDLSSCQTARVYKNGGCSNQVGSGNGPNVRCFVGGGYTGADWLNGCRRRQGPQTSGGHCTDKDAPNGVHYTESLSTGSWILKTLNATDVMSQLLGVEDAEKVNWLKALGAYHVAGTDIFEVV